MAIGVQVWSQAPASNATSDTNINWAEGMAPSAVNDSARALMASVARWRDDNNGTLITSGTSSALTLVTNQVEGSLTNGYTVCFQFGTGVAAGATLAVDGLTATPLQLYPGHNLLGTEFSAGSNACWTYSTSGTGQWIWKCQPAFTTITNVLAGDATYSTTGFTDGPSVSQGSSGTWFASGTITIASTLATQAHYVKLWDGTTAMAVTSVTNSFVSAGGTASASLSGIITAPAGNIRMSARIVSGGSASKIKANASGDAVDSVLTVVRIG